VGEDEGGVRGDGGKELSETSEKTTQGEEREKIHGGTREEN
jgi:hypothetical protein